MRPLLFASLVAACSSPRAAPRAPAPGVVVAELFTSQGCSSCPPADQLLRRIARGELSDRPVIALAFHVDYWDDLGWSDPFSSAAATRRQHAYNPDGQLYTPQLVIDGQVDVIGSREGAVRRALADAPALPGLAAHARLDGARLEVEATPPPGARAVVAIYEDGLTTRVHAGENAGATLINDRVVRALVPLDGSTTVAIDPAWDRAHLGAVVLAQSAAGLVAAQPLTW